MVLHWLHYWLRGRESSRVVKLSKMISKILSLCQGRSTLFFIAFFLAGNVMAWTGRLTFVYVSYMGALLSAIVGHSYKCDLHDQALAKLGGNGADQKGDPTCSTQS